MVDFGFENALTHLFKERRAWVKFGIIFSVNFVVIVLSLLSSLFTSPVTNGRYDLKAITTFDFTANLIVAILSVFVSILLVIFSSWYTYENTQAAIQKRATKLMWEYSIVNTFKKVTKYIVVSLIYTFFALLFLLIFVGLPIALLLLVTASSFSGSTKEMSSMLILVIMLICGIVVVASIVIGTAFYLITMPAYLRLIATDSFSEAFKIRSNLRIAKKYFMSFMLTLVLVVIFTLLFSFVSAGAGAFTGFLTFASPVVGVLVSVLVQIPLTALSVYFTYFVYSRLLGNIYRGIINKEEELRFLRK